MVTMKKYKLLIGSHVGLSAANNYLLGSLKDLFDMSTNLDTFL